MTDRTVPKLTKWPFYFADLLLLVLACWVFAHYPHPLPPWAAVFIAVCVAAAAWLGLWPYRIEYQTVVRLAESDTLTSAVAEIRKLESVGERVRLATAQWQGVQEHANKAVTAAKEIADRIAAEAQAFAEFMQKANDSEKAALRLEVEKMRRGEDQWLQIIVHLLDHVYALYQAGARSNQPNVKEQLGSFQNACRDIVRRVGLMPFEAEFDEAFDAEKHQLMDDQPSPPVNARIAQTLATGYTYQGQLVRRSLVALQESEGTQAEEQVEARTEGVIGVSEGEAPAEFAAQEQQFHLEPEVPEQDDLGQAGSA